MAAIKQKRKIQRKTESLQITLTTPGGLIPMQWGLGEDTFNVVLRNSDENSYTTALLYSNLTLANTTSPSTSGASLIGVSAISGIGPAADLQTTLQNFKTYVDTLIPGGGGEANTASNLGGGVGLFNGKVGVDLQFNSLVAGTGINIFYTDVSLTSYTIGVNESALTLDNIGGFLSPTKGGTGLGYLGSPFQVLRVNNSATGLEYATIGFIGGSDTPATYVDPFSTKHANRIVKVNSARNAVEFGPYTNKGTFNLQVQNGFDNSVVVSSITIKWEKFGSWIFVSIPGFSGTLGGSPTTNIQLVGSYPTEFNVGAMSGSNVATMTYGGSEVPVVILGFITEIRIYTLNTVNITPGLINFNEFNFVFNSNTNLGF